MVDTSGQCKWLMFGDARRLSELTLASGVVILVRPHLLEVISLRNPWIIPDFGAEKLYVARYRRFEVGTIMAS